MKNNTKKKTYLQHTRKKNQSQKKKKQINHKTNIFYMQIDEEILFYCFVKYNNFQDQIRKQSSVLTMKHAKNI